MGNGCYRFSPCICEAGNHSPEEVERRRHGVMAELREIHQLQLEGKLNSNNWNAIREGELSNGVTAGMVHEEIAS
ncbi:hypothetical protein [Bacillus toyonensis]|uniref:hypothetical protein n=1 Tax=Bacillus toyonensis TaxID=155322 RepID=UPI003016A0B2